MEFTSVEVLACTVPEAGVRQQAQQFVREEIAQEGAEDSAALQLMDSQNKEEARRLSPVVDLVTSESGSRAEPSASPDRQSNASSTSNSGDWTAGAGGAARSFTTCVPRSAKEAILGKHNAKLSGQQKRQAYAILCETLKCAPGASNPRGAARPRHA